jgi:hypothetical protein
MGVEWPLFFCFGTGYDITVFLLCLSLSLSTLALCFSFAMVQEIVSKFQTKNFQNEKKLLLYFFPISKIMAFEYWLHVR